MAGNVQNLKSGKLRGLTSEEAQEIGRKGGIASGQARKRRRMIRELMSDAMTARVVDDDIERWLTAVGYEPTFENAMTLSALLKAARGDIEAARFVRDTLGEKPTETFNLAVSDKPVQSLNLAEHSDDELQALADRADEVPALPENGEKL